jgi:hypothetical protein
MRRSAGARVPVYPVTDLLVAAAVGLLVLGPLVFQPGYSLRGDMVFVPHMPWKGAWLGLDGSVPRAVPMDALVSLATQVVPGWLVQKALLLGALVVGGAGAGRLVCEEPAYARAAAILLFLWNPWIAERLSIGQWAIVAGYCVLPLLALAARRVRDDVRRGWPTLVLAMVGCAVCSPSSGLMGGLVVLVVVLSRPRWSSLLVAAVTVAVANLPWLVPSMLLPASLGQGPEFSAFAARAESPAGLLASVLSLGGIWKSAVVPGERTSAFIVLASVLVTVLAVVGLRAGRGDARLRNALVVVGLVSFVAAYVPGLSFAASRLDDLSSSVPGVALLRDSQRFLGPAVLMLLPGFAAAVRWIVEQRRPGREGLVVVAGFVALLPALLLPSLAWGLGGKLAPVRYPAEWDTVARLLDGGNGERTVVLPWAGSYRGFPWNRDQAVLDPAPRYFPGPVLIDDSLVLHDTVLPPETEIASRVGQALESDDPSGALRALGVRWVLVEKDMATGDVPPGEVVHSGPGLDLVDLGPVESTDDQGPAPAVVLAADGFVLLSVVAAMAALAARRRPGRAASVSGAPDQSP